MKPKTRKGIWYFPTREAAIDAAREHGWPADRIIEYALGYAAQARKSGEYLGPTGLAEVSKLVTALQENADRYHTGEVTHAQFSVRNYALWDNAHLRELAGPVTKRLFRKGPTT